MQLITEAFLLLHPMLSMQLESRFSNTAITVEKLAADINKKNSMPQIRPPAMLANTFGSVIKISCGPASGCTPKEKHAGKIISPAERATSVSRPQIRTASPASVCSSDM